MSNYDTLKKIIPPDQALANEALTRSLSQVKDIFNTSLPEVAAAMTALESNKDLNLITELAEPVPESVVDFWTTTFGTGTGPGNTITINDAIGTAAGATHSTELPIMSNVITTLGNVGALDVLTANGGTPTSSVNGVYTVMSYALGNAYAVPFGNVNIITIPAPLPGAGTYNTLDEAFANGLIPAASNAITSIATSYPDLAAQSNDAGNAMAQQLVQNMTVSTAAGIDFVKIVTDPANANVQSSTSGLLTLTTQLPDLGKDIGTGGPAQFLQETAQTSTIGGQAVVASMREGRNTAILNAIGIPLDTQIPTINPNPQIANNLQFGQYTVSEAAANVIV